MKPQLPAVHVATPFEGTAQRVQLDPHPSGEVPSEQMSPQRMKPAWQVKSQLPDAQAATPWSGAGQGAHRSPHEATRVFETQVPPHAW